MDPRHSAQDVLRCDLCETPVPPMYCDICHIKLCVPCVGVHISDRSKKHEVVPFEERGSTNKCQKHSNKICELHCEQCNIPVCSRCLSSKEQNLHKVVDILKSLTTKKEAIKRDLQELENYIYPKYQQAVLNIPVQKASAVKNSKKLTAKLKKQEKAMHREIDIVIQTMQSEIDNMESHHLTFIDKQEKEINKNITEVEQTILDLKKLLVTSNICLVSDYKSKNEEFKRLPAQFQVTLPTYTPQKINREQLYQQLGFLSSLAIINEKHDDPVKTAGAMSSPVARLLADRPWILTEIQTEYGEKTELCSISCLSSSELWSCGRDKILRLYNLQGKLLKSVQTKSGNWPWDITVSKSGEPVYTDYRDRSINIVTKTQIQPLIRLQGWSPLHLCSTATGHLLVTMISDDEKQSKVVRYAGSTEKQSIQWDDQGKALYSSGPDSKYLSENRNFDICVADLSARAVVVVSAAGNPRFRYTCSPFTTKKPFKPWGITTDSHSRILTSDWDNHRIHILDHDGRFLRYIDNCDLQHPVGLCVDIRDILLVAEHKSGNVKRIKYYM